MLAIGICLMFWAWVMLSLGLPRHAGASVAATPPALRARRAIGWALLAAGPAWFVFGWGWELGLVYWSVTLMLCAIAWVLLMARWPRGGLRLAVAVSGPVLVLGGLLVLP